MSALKKERAASNEAAQGVAQASNMVWLTKDNIGPDPEAVKDLDCPMYFGGNTTLVGIHSISEGRDSREARIVLDGDGELDLILTTDLLIELKNAIDSYQDSGRFVGMKRHPNTQANMDIFVEIENCDTSIYLEPGEVTYDEAPDCLVLTVQDSWGNQFKLGIDLNQIRTIHSILSKYVRAQNLITEISQSQ